MIPPSFGRVDRAYRCPTVRAGIVSGPSVQPAVTTTSDPTPDDHFTAGPDCRVRLSCGRRVGGAGGNPSICVWIIAAAGIQIVTLVVAAPDDHLAAGPYGGVNQTGGRCVGGGDSSPSIGSGIVFRAGVEIAEVKVEPTPDNHLAAGPHYCVKSSALRRIESTSRSPGVVDAVQRNGDFRGFFRTQQTRTTHAKKKEGQGAAMRKSRSRPIWIPVHYFCIQ